MQRKIILAKITNSSSRTQIALWLIIVFAGTSFMVNDLVVARLGSFNLTLDFLILPIAATVTVLTQLKHNFHTNKKLFLWCLAFFSYETINAIARSYTDDTEWFKSFFLFLISVSCFVVVSSFKISHASLIKANQYIFRISIAISLAIFLQFLLLKFGVPAYLPAFLTSKFFYFSEVTTYRYGGFIPAIGLSQEPSHQGIALTTLLSYLLFSLNVNLVKLNKEMCYLAVIGVSISVLLTYSLSAIVNSFMILTTFLIFLAKDIFISSYRKFLKFLFYLLIITWLLFNAYFTTDYAKPITQRFSSAIEGKDNSSNERIRGSLDFFFSLNQNESTFLFGTGLGRETVESKSYQSIFGTSSNTKISIYNVFTTIKLFQGYVGLMFYLILFWICTKPLTPNFGVYLPLYLSLLLYHFSCGYYVDPNLWSILSLIYLSRRIKLSTYYNQSQCLSL